MTLKRKSNTEDIIRGVCVCLVQVLDSGMRQLSDFLFLGSSSLIVAGGDSHDNKSVEPEITHNSNVIYFSK